MCSHRYMHISDDRRPEKGNGFVFERRACFPNHLSLIVIRAVRESGW